MVKESIIKKEIREFWIKKGAITELKKIRKQLIIDFDLGKTLKEKKQPYNYSLIVLIESRLKELGGETK